MALFVTMSQTRQEELQWQQCTLAISTERSTSHPLVGVPMILNPAISRARVNMEEHHFTFLLPQWILFRQLFYFNVSAQAVAISNVNTLDKVAFSMLGLENATSMFLRNAM